MKKTDIKKPNESQINQEDKKETSFFWGPRRLKNGNVVPVKNVGSEKESEEESEEELIFAIEI
jgi:hypothetical protein